MQPAHRAGLAALVALTAVAAASSTPAHAAPEDDGPRGIPTYAKGGYVHVELGKPWDKQNVPDDYWKGKPTDVYPATYKHQAIHDWPLSTGGLLKVGGKTDPDNVYAFHNDSYSFAADNASDLLLTTSAPSSFIRLETKKKSTASVDNDPQIRWAFGLAPVFTRVPATKVHFVVTGNNLFTVKDGEEVGEVQVYQVDPADGEISQKKVTLVVGKNIRNYRVRPSWCSACEITDWDKTTMKSYVTKAKYVGTMTDGHELYAQTCVGKNALPTDKCFIDVVTVDLGADGIKHPVVGVGVRAYYKKTLIRINKNASNLSLYAGLRVHGITLDADFKIDNGGTKPVAKGQADSPWADDAYGGRVVGGVAYGEKRDIGALGCAMTGSVIAGNYMTKLDKSPRDLNNWLRTNRGFDPYETLAHVASYTYDVATRCVVFADAKVGGINKVCDSPLSNANDEAVRTMCCKLVQAAVAGHAGNYWSGQGNRIELQSARCDVATNTCTSDVFGTYGGFNPAIVGSPDAKASLKLDSNVGYRHYFALGSGCTKLAHADFNDLFVNSDGGPCNKGLIIADIAATDPASGTIAVGDGVAWYTSVSWPRVADYFSSLGPSIQVVNGGADNANASAVEMLMGEGLAPMLALRTVARRHFVVATGMMPAFHEAAAADFKATGVDIKIPGELVGTYRVADPGWTGNKHLLKSSISDTYPEVNPYANSFASWRVFEPGTANPSLSVTVYSPAELAVSDDKLRMSGRVTAGGKVLAGIPDSAYLGVWGGSGPEKTKNAPTVDEPKQLWVKKAAGTYKVAVIGTGHGRFRLEARWHKPGKAPAHGLASGVISAGQVKVYEVTSSATLKPVDVSKLADSDKDGAVDLADCATHDKAVAPHIAEDCANKIDDDCDGLIDAADPQCAKTAEACPDSDKDGYANCLVPGCVTKGLKCGDCNDKLAKVNPGAKEGDAAAGTCTDALDNDCNGAVDSASPVCTKPAKSHHKAFEAYVAAEKAKKGGADAGSSGSSDAGSAASFDAGSASTDAGSASTDAGSAAGADATTVADTGSSSGGVSGQDAVGDAGSVKGSDKGPDDDGCRAQPAGTGSSHHAVLVMLALFALVIRRRGYFSSRSPR